MRGQTNVVEPIATHSVIETSLRALVFRAPIERPIVTSFGTMLNRPMVLVRCEDADGTVGWGEVWCNFPNVGSEYRAQLVEHVFTPLVQGRAIDDPAAVTAALSEATSVLALQTGE